MKLIYNQRLYLAFILSLLFFSCSENDDGVEFVDFEARFISDIEDRTVSFTNLSTNATSYHWDFGDDTESNLENPVKTYNQDGVYNVTLTATDENGNTDTFQDDLQIELILIINGDFENGSLGWIQGVDDNNPAPVVTEGGNSYFEVNITTPDPNQPFLVNLSQKLPIVQGQQYVLTFDAWSNTNRTLIAGIGLSGGDFSNDVETVNLTDTPQEFQINLSSQEFGAPDARVLFDCNGDAGIVRIDNVSLELQ
jgi:PKD repeat protein